MPIGVLDGPLDQTWSGTITGTAGSVPIPFLVAVNGRPYLIDLEFKPWKRQAFRFQTVATTRTQADTSNEPGEQSLSTESLWRRTQDSWHEGASQVHLDRKTSSEFQFRSSKGVNPWTQWQLSLQFDTTRGLASANTNLMLAVCGSHIYVIDGQALKFSTDGTSWTTVTGTPAATPSSITSDGHTVYVAYAASGIYSTTEGAASASQYSATSLTSTAVVAFVMGRLMVAGSSASPQSIYNPTSSGALPTALFTSNYANFVWTDFTEGSSVIYACGNSGDKALVYRIGITSDATSLSSPVIAGQLPHGETIQAIYGYIGGTVAIGTNIGWRFAEQATTAGDLAIGPLTSTPSPVVAFSGYDRFIWGTYENYDSSSTGLFRMDPSQFVSDLVPAWATDLMASTQGIVNDVKHFNGTPVFAVAGSGVWVQAATYVASGTIDSGLITYQLADNKLPVFVDLTMQPLKGSIQTFVSLNGGAFQSVGTLTQANSTFIEFATPQTLSETIEIRETLNSGGGGTLTPVLTRHTLRSVPAPFVPTDRLVVIQLREGLLIRDVAEPMIPSVEYAYLDNLRFTKQICSLQVGTMGPFTCTLENIDWLPEQEASRTGELNGVAVLTFRDVV